MLTTKFRAFRNNSVVYNGIYHPTKICESCLNPGDAREKVCAACQVSSMFQVAVVQEVPPPSQGAPGRMAGAREGVGCGMQD